MAHETLKATIRQYIGPNGQNSITGQIMQDILIAMVDEYPDITGYATQAWVQQQGYVTASALSGYATQAWVQQQGYVTASILSGYLPLTGGTMTGDLNMAYSHKLNFGTSYIYEYTIPGPHGTNMGHILNFYGVDGNGYYDFDNSVHATSFVKPGGTSSQFLKADGSVDENTYLIPGSRISLLGNDVGYLTSADLSGYAKTSDLSAYLPLSGGTMTGDLNMAAHKLNFGTSYIYEYTIPGPQGTNMGHILNFEGVDGNGYYDFDNSVHATSFVKPGGTSSQFLKADGSVDENTYLIPGSRISLLGNDVGYLTSADLSGYAKTSDLSAYLPLSGGTMAGDLNMAAYKLYFGTSYIDEYTIPGPQGTNMGHILNFNGVDGNGYYNFDNSVHATSFVKVNGTSAQFLKADGSVDSNTYITSSALTGYATQAWVQQQGYITASALSGYATKAWVNTQLGDYLPLTGGTLTGSLTATDYIASSATVMTCTSIGSGIYNSMVWDFEQSGFCFEFPNSTDSAAGAHTPINIGWRGGVYPVTIDASGDVILNSTSNKALNLRINGLNNDGYGRIWVDSDGLNIGAYWTNSKTVYLGDDVYVSGGLEVSKNLNVGSNAYIDSECRAASFVQTSDIRNKDVVDDVYMNLYNVSNAPLFKFTWKNKKDSGVHVGSAAQYWQTILPELVSVGTDESMTLGMQYDVIALASTITVAKTVVNHEERIKNLENKILI